MTQYQALKDQARARARAILSNSQSFQTMGEAEQMALYKDVVNSEYDQLYQEAVQAPLAQQSSFVTALGERAASRDIDEARHQNQRMEQAGKLAADFIQDVDFPTFVKDLLKGVFDANLQVTHQQMEDFSKMVAETTKSLSEFAKQFTDDDALFHLAERQGDQFGLLSDETTGKPTLTDKSGRPEISNHGCETCDGTRTTGALARNVTDGGNAFGGRKGNGQGSSGV
jgi:hypothetical protein